MLNLNDLNFKEEMAKVNQIVLVDFSASWCFPCQIISPILDKIAEEYKDKIVLAKIDIDESPVISLAYQVDVVPMVFLFKNGQPIDSFKGLLDEEEIKKWLEKNLKNNQNESH